MLMDLSGIRCAAAAVGFGKSYSVLKVKKNMDSSAANPQLPPGVPLHVFGNSAVVHKLFPLISTNGRRQQ